MFAMVKARRDVVFSATGGVMAIRYQKMEEKRKVRMTNVRTVVRGPAGYRTAGVCIIDYRAGRALRVVVVCVAGNSRRVW
jgi:hypothetical protein